MSRIKYSNNNKKNKSFIAIVPHGDTLVEVLTSPKKILDKLRKNSLDINKNYKINNN